jgi:Anti-sigma factor NepR
LVLVTITFQVRSVINLMLPCPRRWRGLFSQGDPPDPFQALDDAVKRKKRCRRRGLPIVTSSRESTLVASTLPGSGKAGRSRPSSPAWFRAKELLRSRNPRSEMELVGMARRPDAGSKWNAVLNAIGEALRSQLSGVLREPIPDRMAELLRQLDQPAKNGENSGDA